MSSPSWRLGERFKVGRVPADPARSLPTAAPFTLPELPLVNRARAQAAVREVIDPALAAARAKPTDAAAVARLGMALHAHNQLDATTRAEAVPPLRAFTPPSSAVAHGIAPPRCTAALWPPIPVSAWLTSISAESWPTSAASPKRSANLKNPSLSRSMLNPRGYLYALGATHARAGDTRRP